MDLKPAEHLCVRHNISILHFIYFMRRLLLTTLGFAFLSYTATTAQSLNATIWQEVSTKSIVIDEYTPAAFRSLSINTAALAAFLQTAPSEQILSAKASPVIFNLPMPDGNTQRFSIVESPIMEDGLAAKYPSIKTYLGQGIDDPTATVRFDLTPQGFHSMILSSEGTYFIDPVALGSSTVLCYNKTDVPARNEHFCSVDNEAIASSPDLSSTNTAQRNGETAAIGGELSIYRLALAATGEYTKARGGTKEKALASMVTSINRVVGVYEKETDARLVLINNTDQLIYTDGVTDPYTNNSGNVMLNENQNNVDNIIGSANYDIGHVFSTGGGGIAQLQAVCNGSQKAKGVTGSPSPTGDSFDIDYVAHEIGHQFGCNHTFNSVSGSCSGNRATNAAYEPGGGVTIMAYAGICGNDNILSHSIPYFHTKSFDEFTNFSISGNGSSCPTTNATGNNPPSANAGADYTIPFNTPFMLTGSGSDPDGDALTYSWEEFDLGPQGVPNSPSGNAPIFRPFAPKTTPTRIFPQILDIVNNKQTKGEILPSYARTMKFRMTVRDNRAGGGGVAHDNMTVTVIDGTVTPFRVTFPDSALIWVGGSKQTVTWNPGNSTASPINCANVRILLSQDGGMTFTDTILMTTPNDGSETITVPNVSSTKARIIVVAAGNVFFDMSNKNFTITPGTPVHHLTAENIRLYPNPAKGNIHITPTVPVTVQIINPIGQIVLTTPVNEEQEIDLQGFAPGVYIVKAIQNNGAVYIQKLIKE